MDDRTVTVRDLRNHGGDVLDRVERGARYTVTRDGRPVATLAPLARKPRERDELLRRWRGLPRVDAEALRRDLDAVLDPRLDPAHDPND